MNLRRLTWRTTFSLAALMVAASCSSPVSVTNPSSFAGAKTTWHNGKIPGTTEASWLSVAYGNGIFVAASFWSTSGDSGKIATSTDGIQWTTQENGGNPPWYSIAFGNNVFVLISSVNDGSENVAASIDGVNWVLGSLPGAGAWETVAFGNGIFVASGVQNTATSSDGVHWTRTQSYGPTRVQFVDGRFIGQPTSFAPDTFNRSVDGTQWTPLSPPSQPANAWQTFAAGNGVTVALSATSPRVATSLTEGAWTINPLPQGSSLWSLSFGDGIFFAVGTGGTDNCGMSQDGASWTIFTVQNISPNRSQVVFGDHRFLILAQDGSTEVCEIQPNH